MEFLSMTIPDRMPAVSGAHFPKPLAFSYSLLLHGMVICLCVLVSNREPLGRIAVTNVITPQEMKRVVWYDLRNNLPAIAPDPKPREPRTKKGNSAQAI